MFVKNHSTSIVLGRSGMRLVVFAEFRLWEILFARRNTQKLSFHPRNADDSIPSLHLTQGFLFVASHLWQEPLCRYSYLFHEELQFQVWWTNRAVFNQENDRKLFICSLYPHFTNTYHLSCTTSKCINTWKKARMLFWKKNIR